MMSLILRSNTRILTSVECISLQRFSISVSKWNNKKKKWYPFAILLLYENKDLFQILWLIGLHPGVAIFRWYHPNGRKQRRTEESLDEGESGLKTQHSKNKDHGIQIPHFMVNRWGECGCSDRFSFLGLQKSLQKVTAAWNFTMYYLQ